MKQIASNFIYSVLGLLLITGAIVAEEKQVDSADLQTATFASGCFWCTQHDFDQVKGVVKTTSGYTGGTKKDPTYEEVSAGGTGHIESVQLQFNPKVVTYQELLDFYWHNVDPTRNDGEFCDKGAQYRPVIFYHNEKQKELAEESKKKLIDENKLRPILVEILPAQTFYPAEEYHQEYAEKNPLRYRFYRYNCGRDKRLLELWGKPKVNATKP